MMALFVLVRLNWRPLSIEEHIPRGFVGWVKKPDNDPRIGELM
jgi:hypothetical protein